MSHSVCVDQVAADTFFAYVRRRRTMMAAGGLAAIVAGVIGIAIFQSSTGAVWLGALSLLGFLLVLGSRAGASMSKEGHLLLNGPPAKMDLTTWPYATTRSPVANRVRVTLDVPGSDERTPLAEFKAVWYTPGSANKRTRSADVYGSVDHGRTVLAIAEDGSCYLGRVSRVRQRS